MLTLLRAVALLALVPTLAAANSTPQPVPIIDTIPVARDVPYPGTIRLEVDATDIGRAIFKVRETIPVAGPGPLTLMFTEWQPGHHAARGPIDAVAGVEFTANGQKLPWSRDPVDVYAFHIDVPAGAKSVEARFVFLSPIADDQGRTVMTPNIVNVQWEQVSLYPAGYYVRQIPVSATVKLPAGWQAATALRPAASDAGGIRYGDVSYETLVDSPVFAGRYFRKDDLGQGVTLNTVAEDPKDLVIPADVLAKFRAMTDQQIKVFGARHFDHYEFLNAVSDQLGDIGLEHHRSTEITTAPGFYTDYANHLFDRNVFPHEFTHSWNGKFRRPADLWTPDYRMPMRNSLLWVYEGQTQFWGTVVEARSGMSSKAEVLDMIANAAAYLDQAKGREWRPLIDTTFAPIYQAGHSAPWASYQRGADYYREAMLMWIEADAIVRDGTGGKKGMDDFAHAFFGINDADWGEVTYTRDDLIRTMNEVYPYDWANFFRQRVDQVNMRAPLAGFTLSGYELHYTDEPNPAAKAQATLSHFDNFTYSLGFNVVKESKVGGVMWGSPAYDAALRNGDQIVAVGGKAYSNDTLKASVTAAKGGTRPILLTIKRGESVRQVPIVWSGGLRYPHLVKTGKGDGPLDLLLKPR